mgnify:CR=1 FL=1|tara:strand:+ start:929 stop:1078 length:150 start_codon:yes stop_codon:yes gene_type:complete
MTKSRKEYFKQYYQNNKDKYKKTNTTKKTTKTKQLKFNIEHKKIIITFD